MISEMIKKISWMLLKTRSLLWVFDFVNSFNPTQSGIKMFIWAPGVMEPISYGFGYWMMNYKLSKFTARNHIFIAFENF